MMQFKNFKSIDELVKVSQELVPVYTVSEVLTNEEGGVTDTYRAGGFYYRNLADALNDINNRIDSNDPDGTFLMTKDEIVAKVEEAVKNNERIHQLEILEFKNARNPITGEPCRMLLTLSVNYMH